MKNLACCLLLAATATATAACATDDDPAPIDGTWMLTRTVSTQPTAPCRAMSGSTEVLAVDLAADPQFTLPDHSVFDPQQYDHAVTTMSIAFVAEEFGLFNTDPGRPVLLQHSLQLDGDELTGTASAQGDGDDVGCQWQLTVAGTRAP